MTRRPRHFRRPDLARRGRVVVLALVVVMAGTQAALGRVLDRVAWLRDPLYGDKEFKLRARITDRTTAAGRPLTVVMVGSSRTSYGLRGDVVEDILTPRAGRPVVAFNFGIPAAGPVTSLITLRRLFRAGVRPDWVLLEVMPPYLATRPDGPPEQAALGPERLGRGEAVVAVAHGFAADDRRLAAAAPVFATRFALLGRAVPPWLAWPLRQDVSRRCDPTGWLRPAAEPPPRDIAIRHARAEHGPSLECLRPDSPAAGAVAESLRLCRKHGIRAALVLMPEGEEFRGWYPPAAEAAVASLLRDWSESYGVPVLDARRWLGEESFSDSHHLLPDGADAFSDRLGRELAARFDTEPGT